MLHNAEKPQMDHQIDSSSTTLLETQMTHFPALAPEFENPLSVPSSSSSRSNNNGGSNGIINSIFGNFFRNSSLASNTDVPPITNKVLADNKESAFTDDRSSPHTSNDVNPDNDVDEVPSSSDKPSSSQTSPLNQPHKKLSIRISAMFKNLENKPKADASIGNQYPRANNNGLINYHQSEFRRYWMPDATGKECYECYEKFTAFRRRHHCRLCGQIFCGKCSNRQVNGADLGYTGVLRLCNFCANQVDSLICDRQRSENVRIESRNVSSNFSSSPEQTIETTHSPQLNAEEQTLANSENEIVGNDCSPMNNYASTSVDIEQFTENAYLEKLFEANIRRILDCLLARENLNPLLWHNLLLQLSQRVVSTVIGKILKVPDALNILDFVHIKKFVASEEPFYEIINGVTFSKTLAHSAMFSKAQNVSLMLLAGNISYERVIEKLSSLEPIMLQEPEYLKIQVDRVISRKVTLLLVENSVAKLASDMLLAEGVSLVTNVRNKVLQRVARATNSDIITSLDAQFLQPRIGFVPDFSQQEFKLLDGTRKKILVLDNCFGGDFGVSINLYGSALKELIAVKRILKFLLVSRYSSKLEIAFLAMFNSAPGKPISATSDNNEDLKESFDEVEKELSMDLDNSATLSKDPLDCLKASTVGPKTDIENDYGEPLKNDGDIEKFSCSLCNFNRVCEARNDTNPSKFIQILWNTQLSNSPAIRFAPPYLETKLGRSSFILSYLKSPLFSFLTADDLAELRKYDEDFRAELLQIVDDYKKTHIDNRNLRHAMLENTSLASKILLDHGRWARFRVHSSFLFRRRYELNQLNEMKRTAELNKVVRRRNEDEAKRPNVYNTDLLSPYNCQRIAFLYCANARKGTQNAKSFCMGPYVLLRQFFFGQESGHKDTSLGVFLANYCFNVDYKCGSCDRSMMDHLRRIVHRNARIEITTYALQRNGSVVSGQGQDELNMDGLPSSIPNMNCSAIICWRNCPKCSANSCIVPLPETVYHLSFAKFVDYLANGDYWISAFPANNGTCRHCTFHEQVHFFAYYNHVTCFRVFHISPLHVVFNSMICRIKPSRVLCSDLIEMNYDLNSTASDVFDRAVSFFKDFQCENSVLQNNSNIHLSPAAESLLAFVEQFKATFRSHMGKFDPDGIFKRSKSVDSSDFYYIQSESCLVRCHYFLYSFITKWNSTKLDSIFVNVSATSSSSANISVASGNEALLEESNSQGIEFLVPSSTPSVNSSFNSLNNLNTTSLSMQRYSNEQTTAQLSKNTSSADIGRTESNLSSNFGMLTKGLNSESTLRNVIPVELPTIVNPLPKTLHYELPMNNLTVLVRDLVDGKMVNADIGSVIAYTLASNKYEEKKHLKGKTESENSYCELTFGSDLKSKYSVKVYFAKEFESLRLALFGDGEDQFIRSISRSTPWHPQGGKSGANFFRTDDERFVIKQMLRLELESFKKCAASYFDYVSSSLADKKLTALCKIYGVYGLNITGKNQQSLKIDVLIMEYLFYGKNVKQIWDLKGSLRNRYASTKTEAPVLLDENLVQDLWGNQLYLHPYSKSALNQAITNDCHFLSNQGIMDYSLLAGICNESDEVVIGIVDYVRTYTLDKKVESLVKTALPIAHSPTVVSPELYCKRFYDAIDGYFALAPDQWAHSDSTIMKQQNST